MIIRRSGVPVFTKISKCHKIFNFWQIAKNCNSLPYLRNMFKIRYKLSWNVTVVQLLQFLLDHVPCRLLGEFTGLSLTFRWNAEDLWREYWPWGSIQNTASLYHWHRRPCCEGDPWQIWQGQGRSRQLLPCTGIHASLLKTKYFNSLKNEICRAWPREICM